MQAYDSRHWYNKEELCGYMYHCITHFFQNCKKGPFSQILSHICSCSVNFATIKDPLNQLKLILREHHVQQMTRKDLIQPPSEITSINHSIYKFCMGARTGFTSYTLPIHNKLHWTSYH